ncbi:hypothetical protein BV898_14261 [Hypsibius exemplaris]|uniref:G-protein coupled receptors family 1 profile domain-containing protein n=1 Tax=Hypsibius exemplaris TaxID=2072580 RepID=A0A1W0W8D9_HYPEX|nr:hypothetical protein BV898_14261 [Hypsibius exemplaris]
MTPSFLCLFSAAVIGADRWVSVEYPSFYQVHATKPKILRAIGVICGVTLLCTLPGAVVWRDCMLFQCFGSPTFNACKDHPVDLHIVIKGPFFLGALFFCQARIVMIAAQIAMRRRSAAVGLAMIGQGTPPEPAPVTGLVWKTLRPGMAIVGASIVSNGPQFFASTLKISGSPVDVDRSFMWIFWYFQHIASPFIYLLLFRSYRQALSRIIRGAARCVRRLLRSGATRLHWDY